MLLAHRIVFLSPAGTTGSVARIILSQLKLHGCNTELIDLSRLHNSIELADCYANWPARCCLWLGSPVYCDHAVPLVEEFVRELPNNCDGFAVPFVTWGGVTSGLALPEMATILKDKGFIPMGATKVLATHSSTWSAASPLAAGHPDQKDFQLVLQLVDSVVEKLSLDHFEALDISQLNYLPKKMQTSAAAKSLALVKAAQPPLQIDESVCNKCGVCVSVCPLRCIQLQPFPVIGADCIRCLQCVRNCPENAFLFDVTPLQIRLCKLFEASEEKPQSQIFF